jgi:hypothetical protein
MLAGRKVIIANIPLHILVSDFKQFLIDKILEKNVISRKDVREINDVIRGIELNYENNTAILAMESTDIAKRMVLLDGIVLLGYTLRVSLYQDINGEDASCSNMTKASALANSAHISAKSAAIAFAAFKSFSKNDGIELNLNSDVKTSMPSSRIIKAFNIVDIKDISKIKEERYKEVLEDMTEEFAKFGKIVSCIIIKPKLEKIGAEVGSVFVEFEDPKTAELCIKGMKTRRYEGKPVKIVYIDEKVYFEEINNSMTD